MADFWKHPALSYLQSTYFKHSPNMYPSDYGKHYLALPVDLDGTRVSLEVREYRSNYTPERKKACNAFLGVARKFCNAPMSRFYQAGDWMRKHQSRVVACFAGQGLPEEISLICSLAVASGHKSKGELQPWARTNFGQDCVGFISSYLIALGTFKKMLFFIPKYKSVAGVATRIDDIKYDNTILWADYTAGRAKVRPNPGNDSHIAIVEGWQDYGRSIVVAQAASSKGGVDFGRVYDIVKTPGTENKNKAYWTIKQPGYRATYDVVITKTVPSFDAGD